MGDKFFGRVAVGQVAADPERGLAILVDAAPRLFGADWAALASADGVAYASVGAPSELVLPEPVRPRAFESDDGVRYATAPLREDAVALAVAGVDAPAFHVAEVDRLIQIVDAVGVVLAGRPVAAT